MVIVFTSFLISYLGSFYTPLDHHVVEGAMNAIYQFKTAVGHQRAHPLTYFKLDSILSTSSSFTPFSVLLFKQVVELGLFLAFAYMIVRTYLSSLFECLLMILVLLTLAPNLTLNILRWEDNMSFYWILLGLLYFFLLPGWKVTRFLLLAVFLSLGSLYYSVFVIFVLIGFSFFPIALYKKNFSVAFSGLFLVLIPLVVYESIGVRQLGGISFTDFWLIPLAKPLSVSSIKLHFLDLVGVLKLFDFNVLSILILLCVWISSIFSIHELSEDELIKFSVALFLLAVSLIACAIHNSQNPERWTIPLIVYWVLVTYLMKGFSKLKKNITFCCLLAVVSMSLYSFWGKGYRDNIYSDSQLKLYREFRYGVLARDIPPSESYVFPLKYLSIANAIELFMPNSKGKVYFFSNGKFYVSPNRILSDRDFPDIKKPRGVRLISIEDFGIGLPNWNLRLSDIHEVLAVPEAPPHPQYFYANDERDSSQ